MASKKTARKKQAAKKSPAKKPASGKAAPKYLSAKKRSAKKAAANRPSLIPSLAAAATQKLTFIGTAKSESASGIGLSIDGTTLNMEQDGDTWTGQTTLDVGETITVKFRVKGLKTTDWSVQVDIDCKDGPVKVLSKKGTIGTPGGAGFDDTPKIKPNACGQ